MESVDDLPDYKTMREGYLKREAQSERDRETLLAEARSDAERIIEMIIRDFRPAKLHQWGSLVHSDHFSERSDIDIAVEGIMDPGTFFRMLDAASAMSRFPVDLVQIETIHPSYADLIRRYGKVVYEKD